MPIGLETTPMPSAHKKRAAHYGKNSLQILSNCCGVVVGYNPFARKRKASRDDLRRPFPTRARMLQVKDFCKNVNSP